MALSELRTFRRLTGDTTHMPVEMDSLRALGRVDDVTKTWELWRELGGSRQTEDEARVVYASFLLDQGEARKAWTVIKPGKLIAQPGESELRRWYVAARVAAALDDHDAGRRLMQAVEKADPAFPVSTSSSSSSVEPRVTTPVYDSARYASANRWDPRHLATLRRLLAPSPGMRVLEVGVR